MKPLLFRNELRENVNRKLRFQYLRWLSQHKPDSWCFRSGWRDFTRKFRRTKFAILKRLLPWGLVKRTEEIAFLFLAILGLTIVGFGVFIVIDTGAFSAVASIPHGIFRGTLSEWPEVPPDAITPMAFGRLTVFQYGLALFSVFWGLSFANGFPDEPQPCSLRRVNARRSNLYLLLALFVFSVFVALSGAWNLSKELPFFGWSFWAIGVAGVAGAWFVFWVGRYLGRFRLPNSRKNGEGSIAFMPVMGAGVLLLACVDEHSINAFRDFGWLGPVGWLNYQAMQIGLGNFWHAWPLGIGVLGFVAASLVLQKKTQTWEHRRAVLARDKPPACGEESSSENLPTKQAALRARIREELHDWPPRWYGWIVPRWLRERWVTLLIMYPFVLFIQGLAVYYHILFRQLDPEGLQAMAGEAVADIDKLLQFGSIALVIGTLEFGMSLVSLGYGGFALRRRPISAVGLWWQMQWKGILRIPTILAWTSPVIAVPMLLMPDQWGGIVLTIVLTLLACVAIRNVIVAVVIVGSPFDRIPDSLVLFLLPLTLIPMSAIILSGYACFPEVGNLGPVASRQLGAQGLALLELGIAVALWHWYGKLPPETTTQPAAQKKTAASG